MENLDINFTNIKVINGHIYGICDETAKKLGLPSGYKAEHKIIKKETIQFVNTRHHDYYGYIDYSMISRNERLITLTTMFGKEIKINADTINEICDVQAVLVRWDIVGYDNIWKEIAGSKWAYKYTWYVFDLTDNVMISNEGDDLKPNFGDYGITLNDVKICSEIDYELKTKIPRK